MDGEGIGLGGFQKLSGGDGADTFIFLNDGSEDTITDFVSGLDKIDLSEVDVGRRGVTFQDGQLFVDAKVGPDLVINVQGDAVNLSTDIIFG